MPGAWLEDWAQQACSRALTWGLSNLVASGELDFFYGGSGRQERVFPQGRSCLAFYALASEITLLPTFLLGEDCPGSNRGVIDTHHLAGTESKTLCHVLKPLYLEGLMSALLTFPW